MSYSAAFLDRDGTIVREVGYAADPRKVELLPRAAAAIARLNVAGVPVVVATNQSGIGRGLVPVEAFHAVQRELERRLAAEGARLDAVYWCPHDPGRERCGCRKPGVGLFRRAAAELGVELRRALYIGDRLRDILPGIDLGCTSAFLVGNREVGTPPHPCLRAPDLWGAVKQALGEEEEAQA